MIPSEGKAVEPQCLHVYVRPATIESYGDKVKGVWAEGNTRVRHALSQEVCFYRRICYTKSYLVIAPHPTPALMFPMVHIYII